MPHSRQWRLRLNHGAKGEATARTWPAQTSAPLGTTTPRAGLTVLFKNPHLDVDQCRPRRPPLPNHERKEIRQRLDRRESYRHISKMG